MSLLCEFIVRKKSSYEHVSGPNGYRDGAFGSRAYRSSFSLVFCVWVWMNSEVYKRKAGVYTRRMAGSHFACCYQHTETQTNRRSSHTDCKMHGVWRWGFRTFIVNFIKFVVSVQQMFYLNILANLSSLCNKCFT